MGKKVCFEEECKDVEGPTHQANIESQHIVDLQPASADPADTELATTSNVALKDKAKSTKIDKGTVNKRQVRKESTTTTGEDEQPSPNS